MKSIFYYVLLLLALLFGFFIYWWVESLVFKRSVLKSVNITPTPISSLHGGTNHYNWKCKANWVVFVYFFFSLALGLLAVGHAGEHCLFFQWADGWLREERNCQLYLNSVGNREKEEAHTQMGKLTIYPRTVIYNKIYEFFFSNYFSLLCSG